MRLFRPQRFARLRGLRRLDRLGPRGRPSCCTIGTRVVRHLVVHRPPSTSPSRPGRPSIVRFAAEARGRRAPGDTNALASVGLALSGDRGRSLGCVLARPCDAADSSGRRALVVSSSSRSPPAFRSGSSTTCLSPSSGSTCRTGTSGRSLAVSLDPRTGRRPDPARRADVRDDAARSCRSAGCARSSSRSRGACAASFSWSNFRARGEQGRLPTSSSSACSARGGVCDRDQALHSLAFFGPRRASASSRSSRLGRVDARRATGAPLGSCSLASSPRRRGVRLARSALALPLLVIRPAPRARLGDGYGEAGAGARFLSARRARSSAALLLTQYVIARGSSARSPPAARPVARAYVARRARRVGRHCGVARRRR